MATGAQMILAAVQIKIEEIVESLEGLSEWADEEGYLAIHHKIEEGIGRIESASIAASQYVDGTLTLR